MNIQDNKLNSALNTLIGDERRFELLVGGVRDYAIYMLNPDGYIVSWNVGAQRFKGYLPDEIIGRHFSIFYTPEDQAIGIPAKALKTALDEGKFEAEGWRVRKDGSRFWAHVVLDPIRDPAGTLIGFAKITRDVTERKAAQEALRQSEERFRLLVQGVTDYAIYMLSPTGEVTNWNAGAERIKGYVDTEVVGTHFSRFYTPEEQESGMPARALATAAKEGRYEAEGWRIRKDGSRFWAHVVIDAIRNDTGNLIGFAKITRDITEKRKAEEALEKANAALFQAQKMEAIGQLTGGIAHDFNNLLAVLSNSLDMLAVKLKNQNETRLLDTMQRAVERGAMLTQQLLAFARRQPLRTEQCNINKLINSFEAVLRRAGHSSISFMFRLDSSLKLVNVDSTRFEASILNLVVNARDAMPDGGDLTVATKNVQLRENEVGSLKEGSYVRVDVMDTGTGMPPEVAEKAFEPFFTTKEIGKGTGLGLSQVYGFITQSGGDIKIKSELGKGTTISLYLPTVEETVGDSDKDKDAATDKVLIVEDEPDLLDTAAMLFANLGYEVLTASNGSDALNILERQSDISVLFTDVIMPNGINGIELAQATRQKYPNVKIVVASGYPLPALKAEHKEIEQFTFMNKPYRLSELAKKLRNAT